MKSKLRLSASVDADLMKAATLAVARGRVPTVSAWVNDALRLKLEHDRQLEGLAQFIEAYESEHGEISLDEVRRAVRWARSRAETIRGSRSKEGTSRRRRGAKG
ncbi:MAG: hypothetical protein HY720_14595 [Planctomycetes bacterium]|nr:hypothetical protein [Planctomycetota bacterium]